LTSSPTPTLKSDPNIGPLAPALTTPKASDSPIRAAGPSSSLNTAPPAAMDYEHHVPREWLTSVLICDDCGHEYPEDHDECADCGCFDAELIDTGGGPGRFWGYRGIRPVLAIRQVTPHCGHRRRARATPLVSRQRLD
jgi:hypothetical protein